MLFGLFFDFVVSCPHVVCACWCLQDIIGIQTVLNTLDAFMVGVNEKANSVTLEVNPVWIQMIKGLVDTYLHKIGKKAEGADDLFKMRVGTKVEKFEQRITVFVPRYFIEAKNALECVDLMYRRNNLDLDPNEEDPLKVVMDNIAAGKKTKAVASKKQSKSSSISSEDEEDAPHQRSAAKVESGMWSASESGPDSPIDLKKDYEESEDEDEQDSSEEQNKSSPKKKPRTKQMAADGTFLTVWSVPKKMSAKIVVIQGDYLKDLVKGAWSAVFGDPRWGLGLFKGDARAMSKKDVSHLFVVSVFSSVFFV